VKLIGCWTAAGLLALWALIRTLGLDSGWPLVPLMAFTPYVCMLAVLALAVCALLREWPAAIVCAIAAGALIGAVAPRAIGGPDRDAEGLPLRVMTANTLRGKGDATELARLVREWEVDVLALQELTPGFAARLERQGVATQLPNAALNLEESVFGSGIYAGFPVSQELGSGELEFKQVQASPSRADPFWRSHRPTRSHRRAATAWASGRPASPRCRRRTTPATSS
jgi:hypothetical protein